MKNTIKDWVLISAIAMLTACGGSDTTEEEDQQEQAEDIADQTGVDAEDIITDTASDVVTTSADVNGFNIVTTTFNPWADFYGTEVEITAFVKDHSNNPVEDGTVITFVTDDTGMIEDQCVTAGGKCTLTWTAAADRTNPNTPEAIEDEIYPGEYSDFIITIMGRTVGEDSFIDKNGNSQFDVGETYFSQSEPFIDADDDGVYDGGITEFDELMDYNGNGEWDELADFDLYRGNSCSDGARAAGHCAEQLEVWDTVRMVFSSGYGGSITLRDPGCGAATTTADVSAGAVTYCLEITDSNGNVPPFGTKITVSTDNGEVDIAPTEVPNIYVTPGTGFQGDLRLKADDNADGVTTGSITVTAEWLNGSKSYAYFTIND